MSSSTPEWPIYAGNRRPQIGCVKIQAENRKSASPTDVHLEMRECGASTFPDKSILKIQVED
jgi:hypothetical protein